jgi:pimeloyl-ACP methyl ester carboxylesterase
MTEERPFRIEVPEADLDDLRQRLARTRWPEQPPGMGWDYGVPLDYLRELAEYWRSGYDWRKHEARLNQFPQFITTIDGQEVHLVHVRSAEPGALPLIIVHGWPGSIVEFTKVIGPLADPRSHGGDPADAFHVIAPSIPGFGFSGPTSATGWDLDRVTVVFAELMERLGYDRYGAHGGDFGALVSPALGRLHPDRVVGVHVNGIPTPVSREQTAALSDADRERVETLQRLWRDQRGYAAIQSTRPQTLAYGLTDSPVGQLAWIVEKFKEWTDSVEVPEDAVDRDQLLTNVTLYWLTATAGSSARFYKEDPTLGRMAGSAGSSGRSREAIRSVVGPDLPSSVPTGVAVFPREVALSIRHLAEGTHNIVHWTEFDRGGHFPAMEVPDLVVEDLRRFFRQLR